MAIKDNDIDQPQTVKAIAVVSGKGGSGKTMVAVSMAQALAELQYKTLLLDVDFGTGGLTYYLTFTVFSNSRIGLSEVLQGSKSASSIDDLTCSPKALSYDLHKEVQFIRLIPIGDQRAVEPMGQAELVELLNDVFRAARNKYDYIIADCRGGIDPQSIAVCSVSDEILVVAETDATSIQATQHLVEVLSQQNLKKKIIGFVLNKVMDDPTSLAKAATSFFRSEYLGSIPFDIDATRSYIQGDLPDRNSLFARHVKSFLGNTLPSARSYRDVRVLRADEFSTVTLRSPETRLGGVIIGTLALYGAMFASVVSFGGLETGINFRQSMLLIGVVTIAYSSLVLASLSDGFKQSLGGAFQIYNRAVRRIIRKGR